jgi:2-C-methyl-D-erythritol 4-phosphate cytidylyltransferase
VSGGTIALVLAAGRGTRLGEGAKAAVPLGGRPLASHCLETLGSCPAVASVVVVGDERTLAPALAALTAQARAKVVRVVAGGASREESCARGLAAADPEAGLVLVHDAARPFASAALFTAVAAAAARTGGALAAVPLADTLKRGAGGRVVETVPRAGLWRAQTPQGARAELLRRAHAEAARDRDRVRGTGAGAGDAALEDGAVATDEAALLERLGLPVELVPGEAWNVKITTAEDRAWAEAWLARGPAVGR